MNGQSLSIYFGVVHWQTICINLKKKKRFVVNFGVSGGRDLGSRVCPSGSFVDAVKVTSVRAGGVNFVTELRLVCGGSTR